MAHEHRRERPRPAGPRRRLRRRRRGRQEALLPPDLLAENDAGYRNLIQLASLAVPRGLLLQAPDRLGAAREHHEGLIATTGCLGGHVLQALLQGDDDEARSSKAGRLQDIFGRDNLFVELQDHGLAEQRETNPQLLEIATQLGAAAARHQRLPLHPPRGPRGPRRPAVRADRRADDRPEALQVRGRRALPQDRRRDALPVPRGARGVRQHAVDRRAGRRRDRVRQAAAAATSRCPRASTDDADYLAHLTCEGGPASAGATACPTSTRASGSRTSSRSSTTWGSRAYFLIVWDLIALRPRARHPGRPGPRVGAPAARSPTACDHRPRPDPYDLLFERFLNPSRISMPDIDMDFDSRYRDEMIRYAAERTAATTSPRSSRSPRSRPGPRCATPPGCSATRTPSATRSPRPCRRCHGPRHAAARTASSSTRSTTTATRRPPSCGRCTTPTPTSSRSSTSPRASRACAARTASTPPRW